MPSLRFLTVDHYDAVIRLWQEAGLRSVRLQGRDSRDAFAAQLTALQRVVGLGEQQQDTTLGPLRQSTEM